MSTDRSNPHPNINTYGREWSNQQKLYVASAYSNPFRWRARRHLYNDFRRHIDASPNATVYTGELAYGGRPFEVTHENCEFDIQLRSPFELWHKENIINQIIKRFPSDWEYGCYIDGDFHFTRHDWALETIHQLQHYEVVQMFSTYTDLAYKHIPKSTLPGFAYAVLNNLNSQGNPAGASGRPGSPGGCWAFRRSAFDKLGGLLDVCILGSADHHMACGIAQLDLSHAELNGTDQFYKTAIRTWQDRAKSLNKNFGYVDCHAVHNFHGPKSQRGYSWRWKILVKHSYNPYVDIYPDWQGIYQLTDKKPELRDDIRSYFLSRNEDALS